MSTSSSEDGCRMAGHYATSSGLESVPSILFSLPSDSSDVQTEITPPTSPTPSEGKMRSPRDILDASRRLASGQVSVLAFQGDPVMTPTRHPKQVHHRAPSQSVVANDETGYEADGDGDGEGEADGEGDRDGNGGARADADTSAATRPFRRPGFLRIDTRQHRRVASMLATRRATSPNVCDADVQRRPRGKLPSINLLKPTATATVVGKSDVDGLESYELRRRPRAEPVGLGIGFPENHPLRSRGFSMPIPRSASPISDPEPEEEEEGIREREQTPSRRYYEWLTFCSPTSLRSKKKPTQVRVHAPSPVRLALRPTFLEVSPSPIECLSARAGSGETYRCDDAHDRLEIEGERSCARAREAS